MWACKTNQPNVVEKLLERNTGGEEYVNKKNQENMTALAIAVANKNDECIKHILRCDVPVEIYYPHTKKLLPFSYKNIKDFLDGQIDKIKPTWSVSSGLLDNNFPFQTFPFPNPRSKDCCQTSPQGNRASQRMRI